MSCRLEGDQRSALFDVHATLHSIFHIFRWEEVFMKRVSRILLAAKHFPNRTLILIFSETASSNIRLCPAQG